MKITICLAAASLLLTAGAFDPCARMQNVGSRQAVVWEGGAALAADGTGDDRDSQLELFADIPGSMIRGLTVSSKGRVFLSFPRITGQSSFTLAELKDGKPVPYPTVEQNQPDKANPGDHIFSVMSAVVDNKDRLWLADTGRLGQEAVAGATKLVGIDLATDKVIKTVMLPNNIVTAKSVLHDLRYDGSKGKDGAVYISDSSPTGTSAIIVVDLASGKCLRRLSGHKSVQAEPEFLPFISGRPMMRTMPDGKKVDYQVGVAGLAVRPDGKVLYYCPQASRQLYCVDANLLFDPAVSEAAVEKSVKNLGPKPAASDGLECDKEGDVFFTDFENSTVWIRKPNGTIDKVVHDSRLIWPDSLWIAHDGYLYISASQFNQLAAFNAGTDKRTDSYQIFRYKINGTPRY
jgi:sugar lactone lactonase YvrE